MARDVARSSISTFFCYSRELFFSAGTISWAGRLELEVSAPIRFPVGKGCTHRPSASELGELVAVQDVDVRLHKELYGFGVD